MKRLLILFCLVQQLLFAAADDPIGKIVSLEGLVKAVAPAGAERILQKGASIFQSELVQVASAGKAQIRFTDGGVMNLIANSEFRVDSYRYRKLGQKDRFLANLLKGGFRSLSGSIAKKNAQEYEILTPSATIGLRGTIIEVSIVGSSVFFGVSEGRAFIFNQGGSQSIGIGEKGQFVFVPSPTTPPTLLGRRPPELDLKLFVPAQGGINISPSAAPQTGKIGPQQPQAAEPAEKAPAATPPAEAAPAAGPTIGETPDQAEFQFAPQGGGAAIQGGC